MIHAIDNIPFISYILLRGRCRKCKNSISIQYFVVELLTAIMFVSFYIKFGFSILFLKNLVFACLMIIIFFIDLKYRLIFDRITFSGVLTGIVFSIFYPPPVIRDSLIGVVTGYLFFVLIFWFGMILLFFSEFFSELKVFSSDLLNIFSFKPKKYFKEFFSWIIKNWDIICIPLFLTGIIAFSMGTLIFLDFCYSVGAPPRYFPPRAVDIPFWIFFSILLLYFIINIVKEIFHEETYSECLRLSNQISPFLFGKIGGFHSFIAAGVFWEEDEALPPIGGGDAKFGALIGAFIGWEKAILSFFISIVIGALIGIVVVPVRLFTGKYRFGKTAIPFGPVMIFSTFIVLFYLDKLNEYYYGFIDWYIFTLYGF